MALGGAGDDRAAGGAIAARIALERGGQVAGGRHRGGGVGVGALGLTADELLHLRVDRGLLVVGGDLDGDGGQRDDGERDKRKDLEEESGTHDHLNRQRVIRI